MLEDIGAKGKPEILLLNKIDTPEGEAAMPFWRAMNPDALAISARAGLGLDKLAAAVFDFVRGQQVDVTLACSVTDGRLIMAYNSRSAFDTVMRESERCGLDPEHLEDLTNWRSIAHARSTWLGHPDHYLPIPRTTRALGQCHAALQVLQDIAAD